MLQRLNQLSKEHLAMSLAAASAVVIVVALVAAIVGLIFPKWSAEGLLETPGVLTPMLDKDAALPGDHDPKLKTLYVSLAEFRKMAAAYSSEPVLLDYLTATGNAETDAGRRLLAQSDSERFWGNVAAPVLPFNRRDAREFGELKDVASDSLVGIELRTDAKTPRLARGMLGIMSSYYSNALVRERIRVWTLRNTGDVPARQKALRAEIVDSQMKIEATTARIKDFKALIARYPESSKLDTRQVVSISEGSDRFLSPLAQLVAAETSITQLRETITRKQRQVQQLELIERYFAQAKEAFEKTPLASELVPALAALAAQHFKGIDPEAEWAREVTYRLEADVAAFASALSTFGIRNEFKSVDVASRHPLRLAAFGAAAALLLLGMIAFVRAVFRAQAELPDNAV